MPSPGGPFESRPLFFSIVDSDGLTTRDISAHLTSVGGIPGDHELVDVTRLGDTGHRFVRSQTAAQFTLQGLYNKDVTTGLDTILTSLLDLSSATSFIYGPTGSTSPSMVPPNVVYKGDAWIKDYRVVSRVGAAIEFEAIGVVVGTLTRHQGA